MKKNFSSLHHFQGAPSRRRSSFLYTLFVEVLFRAKYLLSWTIHPRRYRAREEFNRQLLTRLYREILLREPDREGLACHMKLLNMGRSTPLQVEESIRKSVEFRTLVTRLREEFNRQLLTRLYREILLREPDREGLAYHMKLLNMGRSTPLQVEESIRKSAEFRTLVTPLSEEVEFVYERFLFRRPTLAELANHASIFRARSNSLVELVQVVQSGHLRSCVGIRPLVVEMDITNQCNLRCVYCYFSDDGVHKRKREDLSLAEFPRIAEQLFPLCQKVGLSVGTESLLHPKFSEMLAILPQYEIPHTFVTTNGLLLSEKVIAEMIRTKFSRINISMDAASKETYERIRVGSNFEKLIRNIRAINRLKEEAGSATPSICLAFVLMRSNIRELPAFIRLAHELKAVGVSTVHMVPYSMLEDTHESLSLQKGLCNEMLDEARSLANGYGMGFDGPDNFPESQSAAVQVQPLR